MRWCGNGSGVDEWLEVKMIGRNEIVEKARGEQ